MEHPPPREAEVVWRDGDVPVSTRYGEAYYGAADALAEKRHVFIAGNDLPARFRGKSDAPLPPDFRILELGFGTGLNALAAALEWRAAGRESALRYAAFERHLMAADDMARALSPWPELARLAAQLVAAVGAGQRRFTLRDPGMAEGAVVEIEIIEGDARETLPRWRGGVDAVFLDGFSPARNPELWGGEIIAALTARVVDCATLATYSAAGAPRAALEAAGWRVARVPGFGRKKHMISARYEKLPREDGWSDAARAASTGAPN